LGQRKQISVRAELDIDDHRYAARDRAVVVRVQQPERIDGAVLRKIRNRAELADVRGGESAGKTGRDAVAVLLDYRDVTLERHVQNAVVMTVGDEEPLVRR